MCAHWKTLAVLKHSKTITDVFTLLAADNGTLHKHKGSKTMSFHHKLHANKWCRGSGDNLETLHL